MPALRLVLGDQLSDSLASLRDLDAAQDLILMCEVAAEATYVKHHQKKIAFLFAAMRHFAERLRERGFRIRYVKLDDPGNTGFFEGEVGRALEAVRGKHKLDRVVLTEPGEWRILEMFKAWPERFGVPVEIRADGRFLCSLSAFNKWAAGKQQLRMEFFYREMRKRYNILMEPDGTPVGGAWNYDKENRKPAKAWMDEGMLAPKRLRPKQSKITEEVLKLVAEHFSDHFGVLEPFDFAVTRGEALRELHHFVKEFLPNFGDFQDTMLLGEAYLNHSVLSFYLNAGLLLPLEVCEMAEKSYRDGHAPLNAVEGFIRQILGWREFVRGLYWRYMPEYAEKNYLNAERPLPWFYWSGATKMVCIAEAVRHTREHAYSHHIQRLMVTGNFALLAGIRPAEVCEWYLVVYADAYEWVELPNTLGMALFGDGGIMGSKPYAASGKYIHRMSNFCESCAYDPELTVEEKACPFNSLYWDFMARNESKLRGNQRLPYVYANWEKMGTEKQKQIRERAAVLLQRMEAGDL